MMTLRKVYHLPNRAAEGFTRSILELLELELPAADQTTLSRRGRKVKLKFKADDNRVIKHPYLRHRDNLIRILTTHIQHIQKALVQMNLLLHNVISDITGVTGMRIIRAVLDGERDAVKLAIMKDRRIKSSLHQIAKSLEGDYRQEHLFVLRQSVELYDYYCKLIEECDRETLSHMEKFPPRVDLELKPLPPSKSSHKKPQRNELLTGALLFTL